MSAAYEKFQGARPGQKWVVVTDHSHPYPTGKIINAYPAARPVRQVKGAAMRPSNIRYICARNALILSVLGILALSGGILSFTLKSYWIALAFCVTSLILFRLAKNQLNKLSVLKVLHNIRQDLRR